MNEARLNIKFEIKSHWKIVFFQKVLLVKVASGGFEYRFVNLFHRKSSFVITTNFFLNCGENEKVCHYNKQIFVKMNNKEATI